MNQAIQVLDGSEYINAKKALQIDVMVGGQIVYCYVATGEQAELESFYAFKQFEIEELIEQKLSAQQESLDGELWLTVEEIKRF
ncbi:hypothetical protein [Paraglaciecola aestuariivivens]